MGAPEDLFEQIKTESDIDRCVAERETEDLYLDFKRTENPDVPTFDEDGRKFLAKGLSGFANSAGGVLIVGVEAPQNGPYSKHPIAKVDVFEQKLVEQISRATARPVPGVVTRRIPSSDSSRGYVTVLVPQSEFAPHRTNLSKNKHYYFRVGDTFQPMEHYQLEDAFGRRHFPKLAIELRGRVTSDRQTGAMEMKIEVCLVNVGRALAKFFLVRVTNVMGIIVVPANKGPYHEDVAKREFRGGSDHAIHPQTSIALLELFEPNMHQPTGGYNEVRVEGVVAAEGFSLHTFSQVLNRTFMTTAKARARGGCWEFKKRVELKPATENHVSHDRDEDDYGFQE